MHERLPSLTALAVSFARGLAGGAPDAIARDPLAAALLPQPAGALLELLDGPGLRRRLGRSAARRLLFGLAEHLELRTALIDRELQAAIEAGCRQVVLLGAGLDARAHRLPFLGEVTLFEVDHPATQAWKQRRAPPGPGRTRELRYVPVDFTRDRLQDCLSAAGHDPATKTAWILEGVTMYLPRAALRETLAQVGARSAQGSRLLLTYLTRKGARGWRRVGIHLMRGSLRLLHEPMIGRLETAELAEELRRHGLEPGFDAHPGDLAPAMTGGRVLELGAEERVAVATRG